MYQVYLSLGKNILNYTKSNPFYALPVLEEVGAFVYTGRLLSWSKPQEDVRED